MFRYITLLILIFILTAQAGYSQDISQGKDTSEKQPTWEIGADLLWLFDKQTYPVNSIFIRKKLNENFSIRGRFGFSSNILLDSANAIEQVDVKFRRINPFIGAGIEKQLIQSLKSHLYVGSEIFYHSAHTSSEEYGPSGAMARIKNMDRSVGFQGILGLGLRVIDNFNINIESAVLFNISKHVYDYEAGIYDPYVSGFNYGSTKSFATEIKPINQILLIYKL